MTLNRVNTPAELVRVRRAAQTRRRSEAAYRAAVEAAKDAGHSYAEIAEVAGVSRQAVREFLLN